MDTPGEVPAQQRPVSEVTIDGAVFSVDWTGDLDMNAATELQATVEAFEAVDCPDARVDLSGVTFMDSTALGSLAQLRKLAEARGGTVTLIQPNRHCQRLLTIVGFDQVFTIEPEPTTPD